MSTLWQKPAEMRWKLTFASETRPLALSFAMGFFLKGTGSAKVVCGKSNNSQKTLEKRLCSLLNQLSCRRPWAKGTSREDRFYSLGWQKSNFFWTKTTPRMFCQKSARFMRTKGIILHPSQKLSSSASISSRTLVICAWSMNQPRGWNLRPFIVSI